MNFFKLTFNLIKKLKYFVLMSSVIYIISNILDQFIMDQLQTTLAGSENTNALLFFYGSMNLLSSLILPSFYAVVLFYPFLDPVTSPSQLFKTLESLLIETLRSWGNSMSWGLFLIIPGIYKYISYSFVSFIVLLNPNYNLGKLDALVYSEKIFKKNKIKVLSLILLFQLIIPLMLSSELDSFKNFKETPMLALSASFLSSLISAIGLIFIYQLFKVEITQSKV